MSDAEYSDEKFDCPNCEYRGPMEVLDRDGEGVRARCLECKAVTTFEK